MCKPKLCKTISSVNQNKPNVNFSPPYANHKILVIPMTFTKSLRVTAYFYGLITCPTFLVHSGEVTFLGEKKVYMVYTGLHRFTSVCPPMKSIMYYGVYIMYFATCILYYGRVVFQLWTWSKSLWIIAWKPCCVSIISYFLSWLWIVLDLLCMSYVIDCNDDGHFGPL